MFQLVSPFFWTSLLYSYLKVPTSLTADPEELKEPYITTLEPPGTPFSFQYDQPRAARAPRAKRRRETSGEEAEVEEDEEEEPEVQGQGAEAQVEEAESRSGKRARGLKGMVAREVRKVKEELKQELMGTLAEQVAGLVFEKLKTFNFNQSVHEEAGGSREVVRREGSENDEEEEDVEGNEMEDEGEDVEDEEMQDEEGEGDADENEEEEV